MPAIISLTDEHFPELRETLLRALNPRWTEADWQRLFLPPWRRPDERIGYGLTQAGKLVGVLGTLFSRRIVEGRPVNICNLHSWYVQEDYRALSLLLMRAVLGLKGHTLTDFTATSRANRISKRLGFVTLDHTARILPPLPRRVRFRSDLFLEPVTGDSRQQEVLEGLGEWQAYVDHSQTGTDHLLAHREQGSCYVAYSRVTSHRLPYCLIHVLSNPQFFAEHHAELRTWLLQATRSCYLAIYSRMLADIPVPISFSIRANEQLCRSDMPRAAIDHRYSELMLQPNSIFPSLVGRACTALKPWVPGFVKRAYKVA